MLVNFVSNPQTSLIQERRRFWSRTLSQLSRQIARREIIDIFTSEDMENILLESRMWFRMNFSSHVISSKTLVPI